MRQPCNTAREEPKVDIRRLKDATEDLAAMYDACQRAGCEQSLERIMLLGRRAAQQFTDERELWFEALRLNRAGHPPEEPHP
jgi:hypothetical protein